MSVGLTPGWFLFVPAAPVQQHTRQVSRVTLSHPARGKDPPNNDPTIIKTQLHTENQHKSKKDIHLHQISNARSPMGLFKKRETNSEKEKDKGTKGVKWQ